jgi:hypothetical protein
MNKQSVSNSNAAGNNCRSARQASTCFVEAPSVRVWSFEAVPESRLGEGAFPSRLITAIGRHGQRIEGARLGFSGCPKALKTFGEEEM